MTIADREERREMSCGSVTKRKPDWRQLARTAQEGKRGGGEKPRRTCFSGTADFRLFKIGLIPLGKEEEATKRKAFGLFFPPSLFSPGFDDKRCRQRWWRRSGGR